MGLLWGKNWLDSVIVFQGFLRGKCIYAHIIWGFIPIIVEKGLVLRLKEVQKETAREMGYDLITWTFDPLESRNAYLNLTKLRAVCDTYVENCYGEINDGLNNGLPTDRFKVEWWIDSEHLKIPHQNKTSCRKYSLGNDK